ncbi:MAG: TIGR02186 family protein [Xanthobacteraceae bacterium]|nr:TIGR02186 family protein [Xanthobacteraceae bacterium]
MRGAPAALVAALIAAPAIVAAVPARAERLIASLSSHRVQITSIFTGVELVLFGTMEPEAEAGPRRGVYDIVATITGPAQTLVTRRKERVFGIWVNLESRTFVDVPSYLSVLSTRPFDDFANDETQRRLQIGLAHTLLTQQIGPDLADVVGDDEFRRAFLRLKEQRRLYSETTNGVTFLTSTLFRGAIDVPADAPVGTYDVDVKLFADGAMIARTSSAFDIVKVGFERFIDRSAADHGLAYGLATAAMAIMTGWFAAVVFRKD